MNFKFHTQLDLNFIKYP